jgi:2-oxoglutarate ferredoxin oxidoreductase subunit alpha
MVKNKAKAKVDRIAHYIPEQKIDNGPCQRKSIGAGWGSTYGAIKSAVSRIS